MNRALRDAVSEDKLGRIDRTHHRHERSCGTDTHILGGCHGIVVMVKPMKKQQLRYPWQRMDINDMV